ncbi:DedA family protein [Paenibacillus sp. OV219]|uniref:DedA family protein n=1 Tax=Paenibacillus sp. OV219 TaxID=1884377 RepID=UPI0008D49472|nr:DedA family protein [Paenibacillus sp. OV219]SEM54184.1 membrane protein DedA, SNARE-associated domain [Paenibacillus sp. OV219]
MHQIVEWLSNTAVHWISALGLTGVFITMVLESACIPLPSEVILLSGGAAVASGSMSYVGVVVAGVLGNVVGSVIAYFVGSRGGRKLLERYGKYVLFNQAHFDQAQRWFDRHGESTVFFSRNLPFVRTFISLPAGIAGMNFRRFTLFTFVGCIPWNMALTYAGYKLGSNMDAVERFLHPLSYGLAGFACLLLLYWLLRKRRKTA